jgi:uncharacterized protein (TIGR02246 family)
MVSHVVYNHSMVIKWSMRLALAAMLALAGCGTEGQSSNDNAADDRAQVERLHTAIDSAWNDGDATRFAQQWSTDGSVTSPLGETSTGREAIQRDEAAALAGPMKGSRHKLTVATINWPAAGVAVVDGDAEISGLRAPDGAAWPPLTAKFTSVCVKQDGRWLVAHLRSYVYIRPGT